MKILRVLRTYNCVFIQKRETGLLHSSLFSRFVVPRKLTLSGRFVGQRQALPVVRIVAVLICKTTRPKLRSIKSEYNLLNFYERVGFHFDIFQEKKYLAGWLIFACSFCCAAGKPQNDLQTGPQMGERPTGNFLFSQFWPAAPDI